MSSDTDEGGTAVGNTAVPELSVEGAVEVYVDRAHPVAHGRWHLLPDDSVIYKRPSGELVRALVPASRLRAGHVWAPEAVAAAEGRA